MKYEVDIVRAIKGTIFITLIAIILNFILKKNEKKKIQNSDDKIIDCFIKYGMIFISIIFIIGLFIAFSY